VTALGVALNSDPAWGLRDIAADALGRIGNPAAGKQLLAGLDANAQPYVRNHIVAALGAIKEEPAVVAKLVAISHDDASYRSRANALQSLGKLKAASAFPVLTEAVNANSPDDSCVTLRCGHSAFLVMIAAYRPCASGLSPARPSKPAKPRLPALGRLEKGNKEITAQIASYLTEDALSHSIRSHSRARQPRRRIRDSCAAIFAEKR